MRLNGDLEMQEGALRAENGLLQEDMAFLQEDRRSSMVSELLKVSAGVSISSNSPHCWRKLHHMLEDNIPYWSEPNRLPRGYFCQWKNRSSMICKHPGYIVCQHHVHLAVKLTRLSRGGADNAYLERLLAPFNETSYSDDEMFKLDCTIQPKVTKEHFSAS